MQNSENERLKSEKIPKLLASLAIPAICAQVVTLLYNLVDRIYIGRLEDGTLAMAAIGICAPIVTIITAFTGLFGRGGAPLTAIDMGRGNHEKANAYFSCSFSVLSIISLLITAFIFLFKASVLRLFGAGENIFPYAEQYISVYCVGTLFVQLTVGMNYYIVTQGFAKTAMVTTMLGGVLNIALDPIFIFTLRLGIRGAALATVISQFVSFVWVAGFIFGKRTRLRIRPSLLKPSSGVMKSIMILGSAPFFMSVSEGLLHICFNKQALRFGGDTAVGAMTILFSVFQFMLLPVEGVAQGSQPIIGYNYGAGEFKRVKETVRLAASSTLIFTMLATTAVVLAPEAFIRIFSFDHELVQMGGQMLRIYVAGLFVLGLNSTCQQTYNSLGEGKRAFFFAFYRKIILLIPLLYLLPKLLPWGIFAVVLAEPLSDLLTTATNVLYFRRFLVRKLNSGKEELK